MFARKVHHLRHFCFGHLVGEDPALADTVMVYMQHDSRRGFTVLVEETLQHMHDELHRRVIIVQNEHAIEARLLGLRLGARDDRVTGSSALATAAALVVVLTLPLLRHPLWFPPSYVFRHFFSITHCKGC